MRKLGGWLAGILAGIIVSYAVWYFTRPPSTTTFEGMVYSASSPVPKAMVSVELAGNGVNSDPAHDFTDENGSYRIDFLGLPKSASATVRVVATGFHDSVPKSLANPLSPDNKHDFPLTPVVAPPSPAVATPSLPAASRIPVYVRKAAAQAVQIRVQPKR